MIFKNCDSLGLKPAQFKTKDQIVLVIQYLNRIGANSADEFGIALAYDYSCTEDNCSGSFKSLEGSTTEDITGLLNPFID